MIYCIGRRDRYDAALEKGPFHKVGRGLHNGIWQEGGSVWRTAEEARAFILGNGIEATREVYGVEADWETDTLQLRDEPYRRLLKTAPIVGLPRGDADMPSA
jgi:hypothetical protein